MLRMHRIGHWIATCEECGVVLSSAIWKAGLPTRPSAGDFTDGLRMHVCSHRLQGLQFKLPTITDFFSEDDDARDGIGYILQAANPQSWSDPKWSATCERCGCEVGHDRDAFGAKFIGPSTHSLLAIEAHEFVCNRPGEASDEWKIRMMNIGIVTNVPLAGERWPRPPTSESESLWPRSEVPNLEIITRTYFDKLFAMHASYHPGVEE